MSTIVIVAIPLALLGVVALLGFVGCGYPNFTFGGGPAFTKYSDTTVLGTTVGGKKVCAAYWPLWETADTQSAIDRVAGNNGDYIDPMTAAMFNMPGIYPWTAINVPNPPGPDVPSASAPGELDFNVMGIVDGDFVQPADTIKANCIRVNGALVRVKNNAAFNPSPSLMLEAWVRVDWRPGDTNGSRGVVDSRDAFTGFALLAEPDPNTTDTYHWQAVVGDGTQFQKAVGSDPPIKLAGLESPGETVYLAVVYDASQQLLLLYVNGDERGKVGTAYVPNTTQRLFIGALGPFLPLRTPQTPPSTVAGPIFPYVGAIQDVAVYNVALDPNTIWQHHQSGLGNPG